MWGRWAGEEGTGSIWVFFLGFGPPKWLRLFFWFPCKSTKKRGTSKMTPPFVGIARWHAEQAQLGSANS